MSRTHDAARVVSDVTEELVVIDILLRVGIDQVVVRQSGQSEDWSAIELGIVKPVEQVHTAGAHRRETAAELAGELGVRTRHERSRLLVSHLNETHAILSGA